MSLWQIAAKNVWQNRGRYAAYLGSAAFSVMIYFLYAALIHHPELQSGYSGASKALVGMRAAAVVIAVFTFLFLLYSNAAFVRSRMKEFGLLSLFGVTRGQLIAIVLGEGVIIATVALTAGLGAGLLFLKLFFMAISAVLHLPEQIPVNAGPRVWLETVLLFGAFFWVVSIASLRTVLRRNIVELVRAGRQPKPQPTFSRWKTALGIFLVLGGYAVACVPNGVVIILGVVPVTVMVSAGTYLLFREGSIALLGWLHRRERLFYRPGPFLTVSQLVYKMQDNFRVLSAVSLLVAVILTAVGTAYTAHVLVTGDAIARYPHAVQLVHSGAADPVPDRERVRSVLGRHAVSGLTYHELVTLKVHLTESKVDVNLVPYSFYASVSRPGSDLLPKGDPILVSAMVGPNQKARADFVDELTSGGKQVAIHGRRNVAGPVLNGDSSFISTLVLPDATFDALLAETPASERIQIAFWSGDWKGRQVQAAVTELRSLFPEEAAVQFSATSEVYQGAVSMTGLLLFIGVFVSLVFFAACCSLLYFRLFTEIDEDRRYFRQLQRVGVNTGELKRLALGQAAVIFLVPFLVGLLHSTFAMNALGAMAMRTVLQYGWGVAAAYLPLYGLCFIATFTLYWRSVKAGLQGGASAH